MFKSADQLCIVVPIYKEYSNLESEEQRSLQQLFKILGGYKICFVRPPHLGIGSYLAAGHAYKAVVFDEVFDEDYFKDISGYNELMISRKFYTRFDQFVFLLIYQLDAFVFRDELQHWASKNYDYIGAPWFEGHDLAKSTKIIGVGNGGFSLRKVPSALKILERIDRLKRLRTIWVKCGMHSLFSYNRMVNLFKGRFRIKHLDGLDSLLIGELLYEDRFWCDHVTYTFNDYTLATIEDAIQFSFEVQPAYLYEQNKRSLPFGCHAWTKYDSDFWKPFIPTLPA